jgi:hypothetical protein
LTSQHRHIEQASTLANKILLQLVDLIKSKFNVDFSGYFRYDTHNLVPEGGVCSIQSIGTDWNESNLSKLNFSHRFEF